MDATSRQHEVSPSKRKYAKETILAFSEKETCDGCQIRAICNSVQTLRRTNLCMVLTSYARGFEDW